MKKKFAFYAGAAKNEITPSSELMPMPFVWTYKFDKVLDPIYVRVISMKDGRHKSLFITLEMTVVPYQLRIQMLRKNLFLLRQRILMEQHLSAISRMTRMVKKRKKAAFGSKKLR